MDSKTYQKMNEELGEDWDEEGMFLPTLMTAAEWELTGKFFEEDLTPEELEKVQSWRKSLKDKRLNSGNSAQKKD